jgi:ribosomal protein S18 acetylase RimI-like enzyme
MRIENEAFQHDRIARRSFRRLVNSPTAAALVAEEGQGSLAGYCLVLFRLGTGVARLYSCAVSPGRRGAGIGAPRCASRRCCAARPS